MSALDVLAGLVLPDGRRWGEVAHDFQWADARSVLEGPKRYAFLTRARGSSKTTDLAGIALAALIEQLPPASRSYALAADREQGQLLIDATQGFVARTPGLTGLVQVDTWRATNRSTGATFEVLAADAPGAWGKLPHLVICDERAQWAVTPSSEQLWRAMFSAMPKVAGSRLVILTTAGDPAHPAGKLIARARASDRWYVNEVPGPTPWADPDDIEEQRAELPEWEFARLVKNEWRSSADRLASASDVAACVTLWGDQPYDKRYGYVAAVDLGLTRDRTVVAVCHLEQRHGADHTEVTGHKVVLDRMRVWSGSRAAPVQLSEVEDYLVEVDEAYHRPKVVFDPYQAVGMAQRLKRRGLECEEFTFTAQSVGRLGLTLHTLLRNQNLAIPEDPELIDELQNVRLRETSPGVVRLDNDAGRHDDRAVTLAMCAERLLRKPAEPEYDLQFEVLPRYGSTFGERSTLGDSQSF